MIIGGVIICLGSSELVVIVVFIVVVWSCVIVELFDYMVIIIEKRWIRRFYFCGFDILIFNNEVVVVGYWCIFLFLGIVINVIEFEIDVFFFIVGVMYIDCSIRFEYLVCILVSKKGIGW